MCSAWLRGARKRAERLVTRKLDVALVSSRIDNPYITSESLLKHPLLCIMPPRHRLAARRVIGPADLGDVPFVSFDPESFTGQRVGSMFATHRVRPNIVLVVTASSHRQAAFEAAEFLMDYLKTRAPFWKREDRVAGGTNWVDAAAHDDAAAARWTKS